ncbi:MAG: hypothetical protein K9H48_19455 [Melioribacteraceae bacterium]|nr:hypothetical protein [Melioribacteraceae bacterium]
MKKKSMFRVLPLIFVCVMVISCSKVPKFDHYGVYVKSDKGFKETKGYDWSGMNDIYQNSRNYDKTPIVCENEITIYVYSPKAKLTDYKLIIPNRTSSKGDYKCANFGYGNNCPEAEFIIEPIENKDDMIKIISTTKAQTLILHNKEESKGYIFNAKYNSVEEEASVEETSEELTYESLTEKHIKKYKKEIRKTVDKWITLINEAKYREFVENFRSPAMLAEWRKIGEYESIIEDTIEDTGLSNGWEKTISLFEKMLQETPIINQDHISYSNSWIELGKINGKWHQYFDFDRIKSNQNQQSNRQSIISDLNNLAASALAFYKTPKTHGGGGSSWSSNIDNVGNWLGYSYKTSTNSLKTDNGSFLLSINGDTLTIIGTGTEIGNDGSNNVKATITIKGSISKVNTIVNN